MKKLTLPDVLPIFVAYRKAAGWGAWGCLHVVLDDGNVDDCFCENLEKYAEGDPLGIECAKLLRQLSRTQRSKLGHMVDRAIANEPPRGHIPPPVDVPYLAVGTVLQPLPKPEPSDV